MEKEFIPYEQALAIKELGFDEPCFGRYYYKESYPMLNPQSEETELVFEFGQYIKQTKVTILAPLYQQAFRWFREKYNLHISICHSVNGKFDCWTNDEGSLFRRLRNLLENDKYCNVDTYEEAELACLDKLIEMVKPKPCPDHKPSVMLSRGGSTD